MLILLYVVGAKEGSIKIWNMTMNSFPFVGSCTGHRKKILSLAMHPKEHLLISASDDSTIRFWRIETFHETYRFDILDTITGICLINAKKLYYTSKSSICLLDLNLFHSLFTLVGSKVTEINWIKSYIKPPRILVIAEDGGARIISPTHGNILTMIFPIVTHKPIAYQHDPITENVFVLLDDGGVMVVSTKTNPCR